MSNQTVSELQGTPACLHAIASDNQQREIIDFSPVLSHQSASEALSSELVSLNYPGRRPRMNLGEARSLSVHLTVLERRRIGVESSFNVVDGRVRDISDAGAGLICERAVEVGRRVMLAITLDDEQYMLCKGIVIWSVANHQGGASMGIAFEEEQVGLLAHVAFGSEFTEAQHFASGDDGNGSASRRSTSFVPGA